MAFLLIAIASLRWIDPVTSSVMIQHNIHALRSGGEKARNQWVDWDKMSKQLPLAVVASEDQRFPQHYGIDFTELRKVIRRGEKRGASTISQQVAKNMFLWPQRSILRKILEAPLALYIDATWGKQRILEVYLNIAYLGDNIYGVGTASEVFFKKSVKQINRFEAARLAAILPNPYRFSAKNASQHVLAKQRWILRQMKQLGGVRYITNM